MVVRQGARLAGARLYTSNADGCPVCAGLGCGKRRLQYDRIMAELER
ncbi:MAG: hypothetical protein SOR61_03275 [Evtepia sp.]|nr:hypothetical protein [Evtepia sp.]MDY3014210.1 hypothetical protein [Evtepia sp.]